MNKATLSEGDPIVGKFCSGCDEAFVPGDAVAFIPIGPGKDPEQRKLARAGLTYKSVFSKFHVACVTGVE